MTDQQASRIADCRRHFPAGIVVGFAPDHASQTPRRGRVAKVVSYYVPAEDLPKSAPVPMYVHLSFLDPPRGTGYCTVDQFLDDGPRAMDPDDQPSTVDAPEAR